MKRKLLSSFIVFVVLFSIVLPHSFASTGDILKGISAEVAAGATITGDPKNATDGDDNTYIETENSPLNGNNGHSIKFVLSEKSDIKKIRIKVEDIKSFYYTPVRLVSKDAVVHTIYPTTNDYTVELDAIKDIDYILVSGSRGVKLMIYSFEAYSEVTNTPDPVDPQPSGDRAILTVTMLTGLEKEYDLSMDEVNAFINWYDTKDAGSGPSKYAINKHDNNRGPFSKRTDYVIFNNILTFEVSEYSTVTAATYQ